MSENVIETRGLTLFYGRHRGIVDVDLTVKKGEVYGFLGPNGAGKTTTQRILLDVIRPTRGEARIFGMDCQTEGVAIRRRIGYLPGELSLYPNMRARDYFNMMASLHPGQVDAAYQKSLCERLNLDVTRKMKQYSRGNKQKVGIVAAFMARPDLLILDEPTSGLDPLVQQTVLELVREARDDGRTVFFSSHILPEVQAVCDWVGIIREGALVKTESVEGLTKQQFKRLRLQFGRLPPADAFNFDGVMESEREDNTVTLEIRDNLNRVLETAVAYQVMDIETPPVSLEEIFLAFYGRENGRQGVGNHV